MPNDALIPAPTAQLQPLSRAREGTLAASCLIGGLTFPIAAMFSTSPPLFIYLVAATQLVSLPLALRGGLGGKVIARAVWWQAALTGTLVCLGLLLENRGKYLMLAGFAGMALGGIGALVSAGRAGLQQHSARFSPVAHRGGLMLSIVLALADTQALLLYGMVAIEDHSTRLFVHAGPFFASAGVMMLAMWGLWNMRMWGMLLNIVANVIIAGLAISGVFDLPGILVGGLVATAVAQLVIPVPMIRAMLQRSRRIEA
jgi:uncharacterized membrane protein (DUF2068 family)